MGSTRSGCPCWGATKEFGLTAAYVICINSMPLGQFAAHCGSEPRNSGIRGIPAGFDFGRAILDVLEAHPVTLRSELDEQGLQVAAMMRHGAVHVVPVSDVSICSPFPPHLPHLGRCGAHFVGLNARSLPWNLDGVPASDLTRAHWRTHRATVYERVGLTPLDGGLAPSL